VLPTVPVPRRTVLRLAGAGAGAVSLGALAGCIAGSGRDPQPDPVADALDRVWAGEEALVARYRQVIARFPALAARLDGVLADHVAHASAVRAVRDARRSPTPSASASASTRPPRAVPATAAAALADLAGAESAAAAAATAACLAADGDTAALLASVAACESSHLVVLR
jgi:hypothetical protein